MRRRGNSAKPQAIVTRESKVQGWEELDMLPDGRILLSDSDFETFKAHVDTPPEPNADLRKALDRYVLLISHE